MVAAFPPETGGMALQTVRMTENLRSEGVEIIPVAANGDPPRIVRWPYVRTAYRFVDRLRQLHCMAGEIDGVIVFSCDGVYLKLVTYPVVAFCHWRSIPVVVSHRGGDTDVWLQNSPCARELLRRSEQNAAGLHVSSEFLARVFRKHGIHATAVPIIIDTNAVRYRPRSGQLQTIVNTRGMGRFHGTEMLIRVFARVARAECGVRLVVAGMGPEFPMARRLVSDLGLEGRVEFPGQISGPEMAQLLDRADIMLNTSVFDNTPNALFEAFAAGLPVVTSGPGGIPEMIGNDERGYLVREPDAEGLVKAIDQCVAKPKDSLVKVMAAHEWVQSFSWQHLRERYLEVFVKPFLPRTSADLQAPLRHADLRS